VTFFIGLTMVGVFTVRMLVIRRGWRSFRLGARAGRGGEEAPQITREF